MQYTVLLAATSANERDPGSMGIIIVLLVIIVLAVAIMLFLKKKGYTDKGNENNGSQNESKAVHVTNSNNQIEDEKYYLREIRKYVRIMAIIMIVSVICSVVAVLIAFSGILSNTSALH